MRIDDRAVCEWPVDEGCAPKEAAGDERWATAVDLARQVLWALTGRRFGVCPAVYRVPGGEPEVCTPCSSPRWRVVHLPGPVWEVTGVYDAQGAEVDLHVFYGWRVRAVPGGWVEYLKGEPVPRGAGQMVGTLAAELFLQCIGDRRCRLPRNASSATRQGVSVQFPDPVEIIQAGMTGVPEVDLWIKSLNPEGLAQDSEVIG